MSNHLSQVEQAAQALPAAEDQLRAAVRGRARQVAAEAGTSTPAIYAWLGGNRRVSLDWLRRVAGALDRLAGPAGDPA